MTTFDDDLATLERLLGPDLLALLDQRELSGSATDDRRPDSDRDDRHRALNADIAAALVLIRRRLAHEPSRTVRDELTMPLPLGDLDAR